MITNKQRKAIGKHFVIIQSNVSDELFGNKTKKIAVDLKNGTSLGPVVLTTDQGDVHVIFSLYIISIPKLEK